MKNSINSLVLRIGITVLMATWITGTTLAAEKQATQKGSAAQELPFDQIGKVTKHEVDKCMAGIINYDLHSAVKAPRFPTVYRLAAVSKTDRATLDQASRDGGLVRVEGTRKSLSSICEWVQVSSVTPVKKNQ